MRKPQPWRVISTKRILDYGRIIVDEDTVELPDGKITTYLYTPSNTDSVIMIAFNHKKELLLQQEYSHPPREILWQLPGGSMRPGETIVAAAQRELSEESGYVADHLEILGYFYANNRNSNKKQYVVLCTELRRRKLPEDEDEFIASYWIKEDKVHAMVKAKTLTNINLLAALNLWFHHKSA